MGTIVFHYPRPISVDGNSGSQVRPYRMLKAFREVGYDVELICGTATERRTSAQRLLREIRAGRQVEFVYSEAHTLPNAFADGSRFPVHPLLDVSFLMNIRQQGIPVGLFYRDAYWRFGIRWQNVSFWKRCVTIPFYKLDWFSYRFCVDHLFVPSLGYLPGSWPAARVSELPPGCDLETVDLDGSRRSGLRVLYVGGVLPPLYDLTPTFDALSGLKDENIRLILCCRENEWAQVAEKYQSVGPKLLEIVHASGSNLRPLYTSADVFLIARAFHPYLRFAVPVKLFEALGYGLPIITMSGTEVARFVLQHDVGWVVEDVGSLRELLRHLAHNKHKVKQKRERALAERVRHTWVVRARKVAEVLQAVKPYPK